MTDPGTAELEIVRKRWVAVPAMRPQVYRTKSGKYALLVGPYRSRSEAESARDAIAAAEGDVLRLVARMLTAGGRPARKGPPAKPRPKPEVVPASNGAETLGVRIRRLRRARDLSQADLELETGISQRLLSKYELDEAKPGPERARILARALKVPLAEIQP